MDNVKRKRSLYFKNLQKQQKKRQKDRKKQAAREHELQRFESLVESIRSKVQAGEENVHEDESLILQSKEIDLGACLSTKPNCTATGFTEAEKCVEQARQCSEGN